MGIAHEGWWTELGLHAGNYGTKSFDTRYWKARLDPLREYPPVAFHNPDTGQTVSIAELTEIIRVRKTLLEIERGWL